MDTNMIKKYNVENYDASDNDNDDSNNDDDKDNDDFKNYKKTRKQLTMYTKTRIIVYHNDGLDITSIANKLGIHRNTVSKWISRYQNTNELSSLNRIEGTGKNKKKE